MLAIQSFFWRSPHAFVAVAACLGAFGWKALSDERPTADSTHRVPIALLDVSKVFKEAREFNERMQRLKGEVEAVQKEIRARTKQLEPLGSNDGASGSAANGAAQAQQQAAKMLAEAAAIVKRQEFLQKEATL